MVWCWWPCRRSGRVGRGGDDLWGRKGGRDGTEKSERQSALEGFATKLHPQQTAPSPPSPPLPPSFTPQTVPTLYPATARSTGGGGLNDFSASEEHTTLTLDAAIAAPAAQGGTAILNAGYSAPAAAGSMNRL